MQLKKWVERGKEHEVSQDPGSAPPPTALAALPSCPSGTQRERSRCATVQGTVTGLPRLDCMLLQGLHSAPVALCRKGVSQRYAMQSNLSVSMDTDSFSRCSSSAMLPPLLTSITPPASTNNFFIPAPPASSGGAPASPHAASSLDVTAPPPAVFFMPAPAPAPTDTLQQQEAPALEPAETVELPATTTMPVPGACPQQLLSNSDNCTQGLPPPPPALATAKAPSSAASDAGSELGSKSLHNGHRFSIPRPDALAHWGMTGCWPSGPSSVCDSMSSRDQDPLGLELDAFDAAMHPRRAGKLDGPLPWELPGQLRYSEDFVSICTAWQRRNPGRLYNPKLLMPPSAQQPMSKVCDVDADPDVDDGQRCASEVVSYLQQVAAGLKARRDLPDAEIQRAVALLTSLVGGKAPPAAGTAADKLDTPTRTKVSPAADDAQRLQTPQRSSMMPARVLESSPEAAMVLSRPVSVPLWGMARAPLISRQNDRNRLQLLLHQQGCTCTGGGR